MENMKLCGLCHLHLWHTFEVVSGSQDTLMFMCLWYDSSVIELMVSLMSCSLGYFLMTGAETHLPAMKHNFSLLAMQMGRKNSQGDSTGLQTGRRLFHVSLKPVPEEPSPSLPSTFLPVCWLSLQLTGGNGCVCVCDAFIRKWATLFVMSELGTHQMPSGSVTFAWAGLEKSSLFFTNMLLTVFLQFQSTLVHIGLWGSD